MVEIVAATKQHYKQLADIGLRAADVIECHALGYGPRKALKNGWKASRHCWAVLVGGKPIALFGAAEHPTDPNLGIPWMLGTDDLYDHPITFLKETKIYLGFLRRTFKRLANIVHAENEKSIRWLKWAGFTISDEARSYGPHQEPFRVFYISS